MSIKPKLRNETTYHITTAIQNWMAGVDGKGMTRSCISCRLFDEKTEFCTLFNQRPPARVIAFGCDKYEDCDDIPF